MSLSLTGFLITQNLQDVVVHLNGLRPLIKSLAKAKLLGETATRAVTNIDLEYGRGKIQETPWNKAASSVHQELNECRRSHQRAPDVDVHFHATLIPHEQSTLVICHTEERAWNSLFAQIDGARDYSYHDGEPDDSFPADWEERGEVWTSVLAPTWVPGHAGVGFSYDPMVGNLLASEGLKYLPSKEKRLKALTRTVVLDAWAAKQSHDFSPSKLIGYMHSDACAQEQTKLWKKFEPKLPVITLDVLENGLSHECL